MMTCPLSSVISRQVVFPPYSMVFFPGTGMDPLVPQNFIFISYPYPIFILPPSLEDCSGIAIFPNLFSAGAVLGVMGWMNIPLDMMTITIAAISIGIAVDDTIHYIYRFREEIKSDGDYIKTLHHCHNSIGHAMYYTSVTIIIGFSILVFSNFWPTIYFGLFTSLAMLIALVAALTLLPHLLVIVKPFDVRNA